MDEQRINEIKARLAAAKTSPFVKHESRPDTYGNMTPGRDFLAHAIEDIEYLLIQQTSK